MKDSRPFEILLVEDSPSDVRLTEEAFKETRIRKNLHVINDGVEALAFLRREDKYADKPCPDLVLLDLNLPKKNGHEVLAEIKRTPELKHIPVLVLTISNAEEDILKSYDHHANCYIIKPIDLEGSIAILKSIEDFWLTVVKLPSELTK